MANLVFDPVAEAFLGGDVDIDTVDVKAMLVRTVAGAGAGGNSVYAPSAAHDFLADVPDNVYARVMESANLANKTKVNGEFDADDVVFSAVPSGDAIQGVLLFIDTGVEGTSRLLAWFDTGTGFPVTPNGGDINVIWPAASPFIFRL